MVSARTKTAAEKTDGPRIDPMTRIRDLVYCTRTIINSEWGRAHAGQILMANDPIVIELPECFVPLMTRIDYLAES
jgi:hypothetical protein